MLFLEVERLVLYNGTLVKVTGRVKRRAVACMKHAVAYIRKTRTIKSKNDNGQC
jgi:hypothetical protein